MPVLCFYESVLDLHANYVALTLNLCISCQAPIVCRVR